MVIEKFILDPLSVIVKLAILAKKPIGCKIAINNNIIYIQEVGVFQSFVRYIFNNNKNDMQYLYNPIELACKNYLAKEYVKIYPNIKNLFIDAIKGLEKLKETYIHNMIITHTLYLYCSIINNYLGEIFNSNLFIVDDITEKYNLNVKNICFNMWTNTIQSEKIIKKFKSNDNLNLINSNKSNKKQSSSQYEENDNIKLLKKQSLTQCEDNDNIKLVKKQEKEEELQVICERIKIILNMIDFIDKDTEYDKSVKCLEEFMTIIDQEIKNKIEVINL